jgi:hypothetical protein
VWSLGCWWYHNCPAVFDLKCFLGWKTTVQDIYWLNSLHLNDIISKCIEIFSYNMLHLQCRGRANRLFLFNRYMFVRNNFTWSSTELFSTKALNIRFSICGTQFIKWGVKFTRRAKHIYVECIIKFVAFS